MNTQQKLLPEGKSIITKGEITSLNLKSYLNIKEDKFTISNDILYISHNKGNELVLNLKTKEKWNNPVILNNEIPLCSVFNIPISTPDHNFTLTHNDIDIYQESVITNSGVEIEDEKLTYKLKFKSWTVELLALAYANPFVKSQAFFKSQAFVNEYSIKINRHLKPYGNVKRLCSSPTVWMSTYQLPIPNFDVLTERYIGRVDPIHPDYQYPILTF